MIIYSSLLKQQPCLKLLFFYWFCHCFCLGTLLLSVLILTCCSNKIFYKYCIASLFHKESRRKQLFLFYCIFFLYHISWFTFLAVLVNVKPIYLIGANWKMVSSRANNECTDTEYGRRARSWRINYSEKILIHNVT